MKLIIRGSIHFLAALFLFFIIGMDLSLLLIQSRFIDMRFDSAFIITASMLTGIWFFFARVFMNAKPLALWEHKVLSLLFVMLNLAWIMLNTMIEGSISILPAYMSRKALFLEESISLHNMNMMLIAGGVIGVIMLIIAQRTPLALKKEIKMDWDRLTKANRVGMMSFFVFLLISFLLYIGQGGVNDTINNAVTFLKNADVERFRDYLLSFGPLAAVVSGLLMVFQSVIAPLPAFVITFANGLLFGWLFGAILSWSSAMLGAVLCFYLAKFVGRPVVEKIVTKKALDWWDSFFSKYGKHAIFIARLLPIVSFDLVSYAAGVTSVSFWQFFWATGLGQLPATIVYSFLGENATSTVKILFFLFTIVIALSVIGMLVRPKIQAILKSKKEVKR